MGGLSAERDISLMTGKKVAESLDKSKYQPIPIIITKDKEWLVNGKKMSEARALACCNMVFNALHGTFGEDGRIQAFLEYYGKPYTGSGVTASALAMDKLRSREIFRLSGFSVPKTLKIRAGDNYQALLNVFVNKVTGFPAVVKPCSNGSSVGVSIADDQANLEKAVKAAFEIEKKILVEEFIDGKELTCGVIENFNDQPVAALPVTEIIPRRGHKFFDYRAKYKSGYTNETTPAKIDGETAKKIQQTAVRAHQLLGCRAYSRADFILRDGEAYILEVNTLPGLTSASLLPKAAAAAGLTFGRLLDNIIDSSL